MISEWIQDAAIRLGERPYLEDAAGGTLSYAGLRDRTRAWARQLDRAGLPPGAAVALRWPDPLGYATALVAILGAGRVVVPLDPAAPAAEAARVLAVARPAAILAPSEQDLPPGLAVLRPPDAPGEAAAGRHPDAGTGGGTGTGGGSGSGSGSGRD